MVLSSKKTRSAERAKTIQELFQCPICAEGMRVIDNKSFVCSNRHTFDFTKQGYINFLTKPVHNHYSKELFFARKSLMTDYGFFNPVIQCIEKKIIQMAHLNHQLSIIDMGCGEGSHLSVICREIAPQINRPINGIGVDLAKEGIMEAAKSHVGCTWLVADLAHAPFKDHQFDVILNILSPSNYDAFDRLLKQKGIVIKVIPRALYLNELRRFLYDDTEKQHYSNTEVMERFKEHYPNVQTETVYYKKMLHQDAMHALFNMTPLAWTVPDEKRSEWMSMEAAEITVDLDVLVGING